MLAGWANEQEEFEVKFDVTPLLVLLESVEWTDRYKSAALLYRLSESRDPALLKGLRENSLDALHEMAFWHSNGNATHSVVMLGRVAGLSDEAIKSEYDKAFGT